MKTGMPRNLPTSRLLQLGIAFDIATALFALPVYDMIYRSPGVVELLRLMVLVQLLPCLGLFLVAHLLARSTSRWPWVFWVTMIVAAEFSLLRLGQIEQGWEWGTPPFWAAVAAAIGISITTFSVAIRAYDSLLRFLGQLAPIAFAVSLYVIVSTVGFGGGSDAPSSAPSRPGLSSPQDSVYILIFDELGRDVLLDNGKIDGHKYPNLHALAAESVWLTNATTNYGDSCPSVPSLLVGRFVSRNDFNPRADCSDLFIQETTLLKTLAEKYEVRIYEEYFRDCQSSSRFACYGIPEIVAARPDLAWADRLVPASVRAGAAFQRLVGTQERTYTPTLFGLYLSAITAADAPGRVYFLHLLLPHAPFIFDPRGVPHHSPYDTFDGRADFDAAVYPNYEKQVMFVDSLIGKFIEMLKTQGLYGSATIVITGDHGPRSPDGFVGTRYPLEISSLIPDVPLLIRSPRLAPQLVTVDYQHVDFAPTVLDVLGLSSAERGDGVSVFSTERPDRQKRFRWRGHTYRYDATRDMWVAVQTEDAVT